ncbi:lysylphosphatidylglycerol synthase domain-containing protein [Microbacterium sulfonylureivorans]|uniref:lysylphosphatidylglycerol synthase domain-containing protein n=1 Tax=Microbacterium sulfonylureivorans TaxID=2486854 RepID=UPI000FD7F167|nr:lysylphosphatidylglycerol synthase domain-containing protein [Microbacterium sulfonylureivorans]
MSAVIARLRRGGTAPRWQPWVRAAVGAGILVSIVAAAGAEPFVRGFMSVSPPAVAAAMLLAAAATVAASWRWRILAGRLGLRLGWGESVAAYYRSQFLNSVLPGGVVGDVDRAVAHGRSVDQVAHAARAVAVERASGQAVQFVLAIALVVSIGISAYAPVMALLLVSFAVVVVTVAISAASPRVRVVLVREASILRTAFGSVGTVLGVAAASAVVVTAHIATFLVACAAVGVAASPEQVTVAAIVPVLASSIPLSIGGWGPREGAAAWAFGAVGLGAAAGITAATAYGVLAMIAVAPGAVVVTVSLLRRRATAGVAGRAAP